MTDRDYSVYAENRIYIDRLRRECDLIDDGVAIQLAEAINLSDTESDPINALDVFSTVYSVCNDIESFARVCRYLTLSPNNVVRNEITPPVSAVYFKTPVSDKAYSLFSKKYAGLGAIYAPDFKTVCEDVYYDRADACILPLESSDDGLIMSFRHMMLKYELTISSTVNIAMGDDKFQTMALLTNDKFDTCGNICELCLTAINYDFLTKYCSSIGQFSAKPVRITSVPSKTRGQYDHHICISIPHDNVPLLRFFTDAVSPSNVFLGQYENLN